MGILNVTPDSFSDGGENLVPAAAVSRALQMEAEGAMMIDIGAESTRPGSQGVAPEEQWRRLDPVLKGLRGRLGIPVSVDTTSAWVAGRAADQGAAVVNDTSAGLDDPALLGMAAARGLGIVLMHRGGVPKAMPEHAEEGDIVVEVASHLAGRSRAARDAGIPPRAICLDPGIGFGKSAQQNLDLFRGLPRILALGYPVLVGASRKRFLGEITGEADPRRRDAASVAAALLAALQGAALVRVHAVRETVAALRVAGAAGIR